MIRIMLAICLLGASGAQAHRIDVSFPENAKWKEECGSCHLAYPPRFLSAESWQRLMGGLDKHFGENAELDPKDNRAILDFLKRYAGSGAKYSSPTLRISDTAWFRRAHDEVPAGAWSDPAVRSRANCGACHINADRGDWSERGVVMPAGYGVEEDDDD